MTAAHRLCARYPADRGRRDEPIVEREGALPSSSPLVAPTPDVRWFVRRR